MQLMSKNYKILVEVKESQNFIKILLTNVTSMI